MDLLNNKDLAIVVGKRLKQLRTENKVTQQELGDLLGVKHNTISSYERGVFSPNVDQLKVLAKRFNVSLDYLIPDVSAIVLSEQIDDRIKELDVEHLSILNKLIEKTINLEERDREKFMAKLEFLIDLDNQKTS